MFVMEKINVSDPNLKIVLTTPITLNDPLNILVHSTVSEHLIIQW